MILSLEGVDNFSACNCGCPHISVYLSGDGLACHSAVRITRCQPGGAGASVGAHERDDPTAARSRSLLRFVTARRAGRQARGMAMRRDVYISSKGGGRGGGIERLVKEHPASGCPGHVQPAPPCRSALTDSPALDSGGELSG